MNALKRICGLFLVLMAVAVAVHTVVEPLYHVSSEGQPYSSLWNILNPLMVLAIALGRDIRLPPQESLRQRGGQRKRSRASLLPPTSSFTASCAWASCSSGTGLSWTVLNSRP